MTDTNLQLEYHYKILEKLIDEPDISQRDLAKHLGISVGKANYVLGALIERGLVKAENFKKSNNKAGYLYVITPSGILEKAKITRRFLEYKMQEYEQLKIQIENLKSKIK